MDGRPLPDSFAKCGVRLSALFRFKEHGGRNLTWLDSEGKLDSADSKGEKSRGLVALSMAKDTFHHTHPSSDT